jgi:hypothetical protein
MKMPFDHHDTPLPQDFFQRKYDTSRVTLWRYRRAGLPAIVVGNKVFIKESDFVSFLQRMNGQTISAMRSKPHSTT